MVKFSKVLEINYMVVLMLIKLIKLFRYVVCDLIGL